MLVAAASDPHEPLAVDDGGIHAEADLAIQRPATRVEPAQDAEGVEEVGVVRLRLHDRL
jgi:hypothetical protein